MANRDITSLRETLEFLKAEGELVTIAGEVDPNLEVSGITKALDNTFALMFENVKGYPNQRITSGLFSREERIAKILKVDRVEELKFKGLEAIRNTVAPKVVADAPCQEVVITRDIDVPATLPLILHTETDPGRILGSGIVLLSGSLFSGRCVSFKRIHFRGKDWASLQFQPGSHFEYYALEARKKREKFPITINLGPSPAVNVVAAGMLLPLGSDEIGIAGALQGNPVELCKAKTVDAYAIADSEWVIEGYVDTSQVVWESEEAEKRGDFSAPFFPEFLGYQGAARACYKFQATGITHRKDSPIFYAPLAHSFEVFYMGSPIISAVLYDFLNRGCPGLVSDIAIPPYLKGTTGVIIQIKQRRRRDEGQAKNLILAAWAVSAFVRLVVVVDEDVDIHNADEILWAINTRVDPKEDILSMPPGLPGRRREREEDPLIGKGRIGIDATIPLDQKERYFRGKYPEVDLERWLSKDEIERARVIQSEYARLIARKMV